MQLARQGHGAMRHRTPIGVIGSIGFTRSLHTALAPSRAPHTQPPRFVGGFFVPTFVPMPDGLPTAAAPVAIPCPTCFLRK